MSKKVLDFKAFVLNEYRSATNEGFFTDKLGSLAKWAKDLIQGIKDGLVKMIPSGDKKGLPVATYFDPSQGSIVTQINSFYSGTPFAGVNPSSVYENEYFEGVDEARVPLEYTEEDQTVRNISSKELKEMIEKLYRSKQRGGRAKPIFVYGAPGIGKTQIVGQAADTLGVPMINLDLQFMAPEDFLGIPKVVDVQKPEYDESGKMISKGEGMTRSNPPALLPRDNGPQGKGGIIFMDEMNRSNKMVLNSIMQFVQMGRLGEYVLPDKWVIVAAGNRPTEAEGVAEFDFALADRFTIVNLVPKVQDWADWARVSGKFEPEFVDFVERNEELFHYLDREKATLKFPTPRSWTDAAMVLKDEMIEAGVDTWRDLPAETVYNIYADQIGPSAAGKLKAYLDVIRKVSEKDLEDIIKDPMKAKEISKGSDFSNVIYGVYEMALRKAEEMSESGEPTTQELYNIMEYFNRYKQLEALAWIYKRITDKYPVFAVTEDVIKTKDTDDSKLKIEAARMIQKGARDKELI
jgi:MoxR-like ATPase